MLRSTAVFLLILAFAVSATARGSRREPKSAKPPPVDYDAIRTKVRAGVRSQLEVWIKDRTGILAVRDRCAGTGRLLGPNRPQSKGLVQRPEFDPESVDRFALDTRSKVQLPAPWSMLDVRPSALDGIAISACLIDEIRRRVDLHITNYRFKSGARSSRSSSSAIAWPARPTRSART